MFFKRTYRCNDKTYTYGKLELLSTRGRVDNGRKRLAVLALVDVERAILAAYVAADTLRAKDGLVARELARPVALARLLVPPQIVGRRLAARACGGRAAEVAALAVCAAMEYVAVLARIEEAVE